MGLFRRKKQPVKQNDQQPAKEELRVTKRILTKEYRERLQKAGIAHFKKVLEDGSRDLKSDIDQAVDRLMVDMREYTTKQLDITIARVNAEITKQLNDRVNQYTRTSAKAEELTQQSLNQSAQLVYEKYQQMSTNLQQVVASQEVMMVSVFQDNKASVAEVQKRQEQSLQTLTNEINSSTSQSAELRQTAKQAVDGQARQLYEIYRENIDRLEKLKSAQDLAIEKLNKSVETLESQHQQLSHVLDESIAHQKEMIAEAVNENMAQIVEHYLISALGEESDVSKQLPDILKRMDENKQQMTDDMKL